MKGGFLYILALAFLLSGCTAPTDIPFSQQTQGIAAGLFDETNGETYVVLYTRLGYLVPAYIQLNDGERVPVEAFHTIVWKVSPGRHVLYWINYANRLEYPIEVKPGERVVLNTATVWAGPERSFFSVKKYLSTLPVTTYEDLSHRPAPMPIPSRIGASEVGVPAAPPASKFPEEPLGVTFKRAPSRPEDIAVIIGNADYERAKDIPNVKPAHADAAGMRRYAVEALGVREDNVIVLKDATSAQLAEVFGTRDERRGRLSDMVTPRSRVFVYWSGHGAPGSAKGKGPYLVPSDANAARIDLTGYPLATLYDNLAALSASEITFVIEACFSGNSAAGSLMPNSSPIVLEVRGPAVPPRLTVITAAGPDQIASWEQDGSHGLFTRHFLLGMSGEADRAPHGDGDGVASWQELQRYLTATVPAVARRAYGRDQIPQFTRGQ